MHTYIHPRIQAHFSACASNPDLHAEHSLACWCSAPTCPAYFWPRELCMFTCDWFCGASSRSCDMQQFHPSSLFYASCVPLRHPLAFAAIPAPRSVTIGTAGVFNVFNTRHGSLSANGIVDIARASLVQCPDKHIASVHGTGSSCKTAAIYSAWNPGSK